MQNIQKTDMLKGKFSTFNVDISSVFMVSAVSWSNKFLSACYADKKKISSACRAMPTCTKMHCTWASHAHAHVTVYHSGKNQLWHHSLVCGLLFWSYGGRHLGFLQQEKAHAAIDCTCNTRSRKPRQDLVSSSILTICSVFFFFVVKSAVVVIPIWFICAC